MELTVAAEGDPLQIRTQGTTLCASAEQNFDPMSALFGGEIFRRRVLLDMSNTVYLDSQGVGWLLKMHKHFCEAGGRLVIHSVTPMVMQVFRLMRLTKVFQLAPDVASAQQAVLSEAPR